MSNQKPPENDELWPHGEKREEVEKLFELASELSDEKTAPQVAKLEAEYAKTKKILASPNGDYGTLRDMPVEVLDGALGELCERYMLNRFPVAYAWPAMLAVASTMVPRYSAKQRVNLYVALVGPVHTGKSQAIEASVQLLGLKPPALMEMFAGSGEQLVRKCGDAKGTPRLFSPDELGHMLEKSHIENASFPYILNLAFYKSQFEVHMGKRQSSVFDASLSILGSLVEDRFEDLFSHSTTAGLSDRFMLSQCPGGYKFHYFPFEFEPERFELQAVGVHPDVWLEKEAWLLADPELSPRVVEIALRAAIVCASFSGKTLLTVADLKPAHALVEYQNRIRRYLKPNDGENPEAKIAMKFMAYLKRYGGREVTKRKMFHDCGADRCGYTIADRALKALYANDDVYVTGPKERPTMVRLVIEDEEEEENS